MAWHRAAAALTLAIALGFCAYPARAASAVVPPPPIGDEDIYTDAPNPDVLKLAADYDKLAARAAKRLTAIPR